MAFMEPEIVRCDYYVIDGRHGTTFLPCDVEPGATTAEQLRDYVEDYDADAIVTVEHGILGRLSAPGYLDCTEWTPYATRAGRWYGHHGSGVRPTDGRAA